MTKLHVKAAEPVQQSDVADDIMRCAAASNVPLRADPELAAALAHLDVSSVFPPELFRAVAEVLAFVYTIDRKA